MNQHRRTVAKLKADAERSSEGYLAEQKNFHFVIEDVKRHFGQWDRYDPVVWAILRVVQAQNDFAHAIDMSANYGADNMVEDAIDERIKAVTLCRRLSQRTRVMGNEVIVVVPKQLNDEQTRRSERAELCLWTLLEAAKRQTDPATWLNFGLLEAEAFLEAIHTGTPHPLLKTHGERAATRGSRSPPLANERHARRLIVLALVAVQRAGAGKAASRRLVAEELKRMPLFPNAPTMTVLEHWQNRLEPPVMPYDEILLARGISRCGIKDLSNLANYFIGIAHATFNPTALAVAELP